MEQRMYQGQIDPNDLAQALLDEWDRGDTIAQALQGDREIIVQIGQREGGWLGDEPRQALTIGLEPTGDGLRVTMGQQQWYKEQQIQIFGGGLIGFFPFFFAWPLGDIFGGGSDQVDQSLPGQVWRFIEQYTSTRGAATGATHRLAMHPCPNCGVANPQGAERCSACGASLTGPTACPRCHQLNPASANFCLNCGTPLHEGAGVVDVGM